MTQEILSLKRFAAWATGLTDRYKTDPIFQANAQIALLQLLLTLVLLGFLWSTYHYLSANAAETFGEDLSTGIRSPEVFASILADRRRFLFIFLFIGFFALTTVFSVLMARIATRPSRQTLSFQKRFIGNIAHEIRTPLAIIKTSTEVALFDPALPERVRETFEETIVELNRISETINNLLSFDSLLRPKSMQFEPVDLSEIAKTVCERHQNLANSRGITLSCTTIDHAVVNGNAIALEQVITNLTKNALNYTPANKNGKVTVEIDRAQNGGISIATIDTGIGIAQKDLYHVFEPFFRADTSRARGIGTGTSGLGLAIVNEIARLHQGTITLRSAVGHGTTIKITFPPYRDMRQELPLLEPSGSPHEATLDFS